MSGDKAKARLQFTMAGIDLPDPAVKPLRRPREDRLVTEGDIINECEYASVISSDCRLLLMLFHSAGSNK